MDTSSRTRPRMISSANPAQSAPSSFWPRSCITDRHQQPIGINSLEHRSRRIAAVIASVVVFFALPAVGAPDIRMSTTTSTEASGLLPFLLPPFQTRCQCKVRVVAVGTGKALELAKNGDVDVVLVH